VEAGVFETAARGGSLCDACISPDPLCEGLELLFRDGDKDSVHAVQVMLVGPDSIGAPAGSIGSSVAIDGNEGIDGIWAVYGLYDRLAGDTQGSCKGGGHPGVEAPVRSESIVFAAVELVLGLGTGRLAAHIVSAGSVIAYSHDVLSLRAGGGVGRRIS